MQHLSDEEEAPVAAVNATGTLRDQAIITLLHLTDLRTQELCTLTLQQIHLGKRNGMLHIIGKRKKVRSVSPREILVWGTFVGNTLLTYRGHLGSASIKWSPDSRYIASVSTQDSTLQVWNAKTGTRRFTSYSKDEYPGVQLQWSPNGRFIVFDPGKSKPGESKLRILDAVTGAVRWNFDGYEAAWSPDGRHIAIDKYRMLEVRDATTGAAIHSYQTELFLYGVSWSPDGKRIAMYSSDSGKSSTGDVYVWDTSGGFKFSRKPVTLRTGKADRIRWLPDSRHITVGGWRIQVWDSIKGVRLANYEGHLSADNKYIASFKNQEVQVRDVITGAEIVTYRNHTADVQALAWAPDGRRIASYDANQAVYVWDITTGTEIATYKNLTGNVDGLVWSPNGRYIAFSFKGLSTHVSVWDMSQGTHSRTYQCPPGVDIPSGHPTVHRSPWQAMVYMCGK